VARFCCCCLRITRRPTTSAPNVGPRDVEAPSHDAPRNENEAQDQGAQGKKGAVHCRVGGVVFRGVVNSGGQEPHSTNTNVECRDKPAIRRAGRVATHTARAPFRGVVAHWERKAHYETHGPMGSGVGARRRGLFAQTAARAGTTASCPCEDYSRGSCGGAMEETDGEGQPSSPPRHNGKRRRHDALARVSTKSQMLAAWW
jgi:hypothetical protein